MVVGIVLLWQKHLYIHDHFSLAVGSVVREGKRSVKLWGNFKGCVGKTAPFFEGCQEVLAGTARIDGRARGSVQELRMIRIS